jgi:hypothetical protein
MGFTLGGFAADRDVVESILEEHSMFSIDTPATSVSPVGLQKKRGNNERVVTRGSKRQRQQSTKAKEMED